MAHATHDGCSQPAKDDASRAAISTASREEMVISPTAFRLCWCLISLYHLINGLFIVILGAIHIYISLPGHYESLYLIEIDQQVMSTAGWTLFAIGIAHLLILISNVGQSLVRCRLSFGHDATRRATRVQPTMSIVKRAHHSTTVASSFVVKAAQFFVSDKGIFGVYGRHFDTMFYARQGVEIVMLSYQALQLSFSVERRWINHLVVTLVLVNCAFVPIVTRVVKGDITTHRSMLLTLDLALDFAVMVIVPILVIAPPALDFDWAAGSYNQSLTYDDVWLTNTVSEARQVMISNHIDYLSTVFPHTTGLFTLSSIKDLLYRMSVTKLKQQSSPGPLMAMKESRLTRIVRRLFYMVASAWAMLTIICHAIAQNREPSTVISSSCSLHVHAWMATNSTCSVVQINCYRRDIKGREEEIGQLLAELERSTLTRLIISHCPALSMSPVVTEFPRLRCIEVFNSTVNGWRDDAVVTRSASPLLNQLHFLASNFSVFPKALFTEALPPLTGLLIHSSNLTELPDLPASLFEGRIWPYFSIEYTGIKALPPVLSLIHAVRLSLVGNQILTLDDGLFDSVYQSISISGNPIKSLPPTVGDTTGLYQFVAEDTALDSLPSWFDRWSTARRARGLPLVVSLRNSPVCESNQLLLDLCEGLPPHISGQYRFDLISVHREI